MSSDMAEGCGRREMEDGIMAISIRKRVLLPHCAD